MKPAVFYKKILFATATQKTLGLFRVSLAKRLGLTVVFSKIKTE